MASTKNSNPEVLHLKFSFHGLGVQFLHPPGNVSLSYCFSVFLLTKSRFCGLPCHVILSEVSLPQINVHTHLQCFILDFHRILDKILGGGNLASKLIVKTMYMLCWHITRHWKDTSNPCNFYYRYVNCGKLAKTWDREWQCKAFIWRWRWQQQQHTHIYLFIYLFIPADCTYIH